MEDVIADDRECSRISEAIRLSPVRLADKGGDRPGIADAAEHGASVTLTIMVRRRELRRQDNGCDVLDRVREAPAGPTHVDRARRHLRRRAPLTGPAPRRRSI